MKRAALLFLTVPLWAQIERSRVGMMLDSTGALRPVFGIAASATLGEPVMTEVTSSACSSSMCLAAISGPVIFGMDGDTAYIYFPLTKTIGHWAQGQFTSINFVPDGDVISLRAARDGFDYAIRLGKTIWIEHYSIHSNQIELLQRIGSAGPVILIADGVLISDQERVQIVRSDGSARAFRIGNVTGFVALGSGVVEAITQNGVWAIQTTLGAEAFYLLPGAAP